MVVFAHGALWRLQRKKPACRAHKCRTHGASTCRLRCSLMHAYGAHKWHCMALKSSGLRRFFSTQEYFYLSSYVLYNKYNSQIVIIKGIWIQRETWCMGPNAGVDLTSPYVVSRVDTNTFTMGNPLPESTLTLCQSRLYRPVRDEKFGLWHL